MAALRSVCAANGLSAPAGCSKDELIELLETRSGVLPAIELSKDTKEEAAEEAEEEWAAGNDAEVEEEEAGEEEEEEEEEDDGI